MGGNRNGRKKEKTAPTKPDLQESALQAGVEFRPAAFALDAVRRLAPGLHLGNAVKVAPSGNGVRAARRCAPARRSIGQEVWAPDRIAP